MSYKKKIDKLTRENHFVYITGVFYFHFDIGLELNSHVFLQSFNTKYVHMCIFDTIYVHIHY
ncbi:hypothetical protein BK732_18385 [Bacillus thuringiensis serovar navarrensis]|uniref:Uncharacterized protein n=1 Tax=Bacillus thuringiensis serovar navarrensis TaxID=339658 RepID=A0A243ABA7_BACTU|nr:hypothetical protein BK732_18385 [Bacillus thuringiensis serovar navarrensis]